jgi:hypothetical protein
MAIEDTMAQLAHSQVTQCLPSMADDLQGFQLVYSNEDINASVGVLVAVVNNLVVYIPAVYRKGKIYNMDIMYIPELHQWLPTQDNWVTYIRSKRADIEAIVRDRDVVSRSGKASSINLDTPLLKIVKHASGIATTGDDVENLGIPAVLKQAADFVTKALENPVMDLHIPCASALLKKTASTSVVRGLVNAIAEHPTVTNSFAQFYTDDDMREIIEAVNKANAMLADDGNKHNTDGEVRVITSASSEARSLTDDEKVTILRDGAVIKDTRGLVPTKIFKTKTRGAWSCPVHNGIYELLKYDGSTLTAMVVVSPRTDYKKRGGCAVVIPLDDGKAHVAHKAPHNILGQLIPVPTVSVSGGAPVTKLTKLTYALVVDTNGDALFINYLEPKYVGSSDYIVINPGNSCRVSRRLDEGGWQDGGDRITRIVQIPARGQLRVSGETLYVPESASFFESTTWDSDNNTLGIATDDSFVDSIRQREKLLSIKLYSAGDTVVVSDDTGRETAPISKTAAAHDLVKNYAIVPEVASAMVKEASASKQVRYLAKIAASSALAMAMGDSNPSETDIQTVDLNGKVPDDARKMIQDASNTGVKEIMDVSVLKMLADDSSSVRIIQDLLPQLFGAMNAVGQLLFMVRASTSMSEEYGEIRSTEMEKQFTTLMQRLGDVVIALQRGRVDDVSDLLEGKLSATLG